MARIEGIAEQAERDRELKRTELETERESTLSEKLAQVRDPKLPYFEESKDKMDSYLSRFEKYATANKWDKHYGNVSVFVW